MILTLLLFLLILGLLVNVHELGHFIAARASAIRVEEFAFGFPPRLLSRRAKGTRYSLNLIPLGGYVRLLGEEAVSTARDSYSAKPPHLRLIVVVAGVVANLVLAWLLLTIWFAFTITRPPANAVVISQVLSSSAAAQAGLVAGDVVVAADGVAIAQAKQLAEFTKAHAGSAVTFTIRRFGRSVSKTLVLGQKEAPLGVAPVDLGRVPEGLSPWRAPLYALAEISSTVAVNARFLSQAVGSLLGGPKVEGEVAGPVGIFGILSQMVSLGPLYILRFIANLSLLVGFFNILPVPALDGGKAAFVLSELISRRRLIREQLEQTIHFVGFVLLLSLIAIVTYRDIIRLVTRQL